MLALVKALYPIDGEAVGEFRRLGKFVSEYLFPPESKTEDEYGWSEGTYRNSFNTIASAFDRFDWQEAHPDPTDPSSSGPLELWSYSPGTRTDIWEDYARFHGFVLEAGYTQKSYPSSTSWRYGRAQPHACCPASVQR